MAGLLLQLTWGAYPSGVQISCLSAARTVSASSIDTTTVSSPRNVHANHVISAALSYVLIAIVATVSAAMGNEYAHHEMKNCMLLNIRH